MINSIAITLLLLGFLIAYQRLKRNKLRFQTHQQNSFLVED